MNQYAKMAKIVAELCKVMMGEKKDVGGMEEVRGKKGGKGEEGR